MAQFHYFWPGSHHFIITIKMLIVLFTSICLFGFTGILVFTLFNLHLYCSKHLTIKITLTRLTNANASCDVCRSRVDNREMSKSNQCCGMLESNPLSSNGAQYRCSHTFIHINSSSHSETPQKWQCTTESSYISEVWSVSSGYTTGRVFTLKFSAQM